MWRENTLSMRSEQGGEERSELLIDVQQMSKIYNEGRENEVRALDNISLSVRWGEFLCILGQSGSGKSTLMNILGCLDIPTYGTYYLDGQPVSDMKPSVLAGIRNREIGFIFQGFNLIANLNAIENVELPLIYRGIDRKTRHELAIESLKMVGLEKRMDHKPSEMSGGQQQRVSIGRAIVKNPDILLCDEPTGALDYNTSKEILKLIEDVNKKYGNTVIMVTHNEAIRHMADHVIKLRDGSVRHNDINEQKISAMDLEW